MEEEKPERPARAASGGASESEQRRFGSLEVSCLFRHASPPQDYLDLALNAPHASPLSRSGVGRWERGTGGEVVSPPPHPRHPGPRRARLDLRPGRAPLAMRPGPGVALPGPVARRDGPSAARRKGRSGSRRLLDRGTGGGCARGAAAGSPRQPDVLVLGSAGGDSWKVFYPEGGVAGPDGRFRLTGLRPGDRYDLHIRLEGYLPGRALDVEAPTREPLRIVLEEAPVLTGRVVGPAGEPISGADIRARLDEDAAEAWTSVVASRQDGSFRMPVVRPGSVTIRVWAQGYRARLVQGIQLSQRAEAGPIEIALDKGAVLEGRVLDEQGNPVPGAAVTARKAEVPNSIDGISFHTDFVPTVKHIGRRRRAVPAGGAGGRTPYRPGGVTETESLDPHGGPTRLAEPGPAVRAHIPGRRAGDRSDRSAGGRRGRLPGGRRSRGPRTRRQPRRRDLRPSGSGWGLPALRQCQRLRGFPARARARGRQRPRRLRAAARPGSRRTSLIDRPSCHPERSEGSGGRKAASSRRSCLRDPGPTGRQNPARG